MDRPTVIFDIDHTLVIDNKLERVAFLHLLARVIASGGRALGPLMQETVAIDALLQAQRGGAFSIDEAVNRFVRDRGATPSEADAEFFRSRALSMVDDFVVADPDAAATLLALEARGCLVAVLSNGWNPLQVRKAARAGFAGPVIASADLGFQKPDGRAFLAAATQLGVDPASVWYVGDDPKNDVVGALGAGMRAIWLDNEGRSYPAAAPQPTHRIGALPEILALVSGQ